MNDSLWPEFLSRWLDGHEAETIADIAEDAVAGGDDPYLAAASNDRDEVAAAVEAVSARRAAAEAEMQQRDTLDPADWPTRDAASADFDRLDRALAMLRRRLAELDDAAGLDELREMRAGYWQRAI